MPKYTLHYFNGRALGEGPRLLFAYGGQEFEDVRYTVQTWPAFKPKTLFGSVPVLFIDDKQYAQSLAISRYLGKKYGLVGDNDEENLEIDQNVDFVNDIRAKAAIVQYEKDEAVKEKKHKDNSENVYPGYFAKLNAIIEQNNGHIAAGKLTWGDFWVAGIIDYIKAMVRIPDFEEKYPAIKTLVNKVYSIPKVKAFANAASLSGDY
ncbi:unnamed protein product [Arctia plantaginis]|uniref:glutathione transferase n=1 Tax=Arctia plantaginis TaxID=874455 RepID=A0A8S0ZMQ9_ARCPL|nr:unnamed protein product [Arctia plantaginis]